MKVVIVGAGAVGLQIAKQLVDEKKDVVLIEQDPERARLAANRLDCIVINKEGNSLEALKEAGTENADFFIAVTDSDEVNLISCVLVESEYSVPFKIARVRSIDYASTPVAEKGFLGIDFIVNPEIVAAETIIRNIEHGAVSDIMLFERSDAQLRHLTVEPDSPFANRPLSETGRSLGVNFLIAAVLRDNNYIIPSGTTVLHPGDIMYIVATERNFESLYEHLGKVRMELRKVVIVGGGKIGSMVASFLLEGNKRPQTVIKRLMSVFSEDRRRSVKIIDRDYARCKTLSQQHPGALVIHADVSDEGVFEEEHFANSDLVIAVTGDQELNLVTSVYAKTLGIKRSICLVNKTNYTRVASQLGIDVPVSLKNSVVNTILKLVRKGNIRNVHSISGGTLEVLEISVDSHSIAAGKRIREIKLPQGALVISFLRENETFIPDGEYELQGGDHIVVIARVEVLERIQTLFTAAA